MFTLLVYVLLGQVQVQRNEEDAHWRQRFHALSDQSDSTIKLLKKENQRLRVKVEELEDQSSTQMQQVISTTTSVKVEPQEEDALAEIPQSSASSSITGRLTKISFMQWSNYVHS